MPLPVPKAPPVIKSIEPGTLRPKWSVMLPCYNCHDTIQFALESVLMQAYPEAEMEIEVVDDCSTRPGLKELVDTIGKGRVKYFRHGENSGHVNTYNTCVNRSKGHYIHILHADDEVKNGFYKKIDQLFSENKEAGAAFTCYEYMNDRRIKLRTAPMEADAEGIIPNMLMMLSERIRMQYVIMVVKREVYEQLGAFYGSNYCEDWVMWSRIAKEYPIAYSPAILGRYREHANQSQSWKSISDGSNISEMAFAFSTISSLLPAEIAEESKRKAMKMYFLWILDIVDKFNLGPATPKIARLQIEKIKEQYMDKDIKSAIYKLQYRLFKKRVKAFLKKMVNR